MCTANEISTSSPEKDVGSGVFLQTEELWQCDFKCIVNSLILLRGRWKTLGEIAGMFVVVTGDWRRVSEWELTDSSWRLSSGRGKTHRVNKLALELSSRWAHCSGRRGSEEYMKCVCSSSVSDIFHLKGGHVPLLYNVAHLGAVYFEAALWRATCRGTRRVRLDSFQTNNGFISSIRSSVYYFKSIYVFVQQQILKDVDLRHKPRSMWSDTPISLQQKNK